jgi:hypothetical protein
MVRVIVNQNMVMKDRNTRIIGSNLGMIFQMSNFNRSKTRVNKMKVITSRMMIRKKK